MGPYTWDRRAHQYRDAAGRFVPRTQIRNALVAALESEERRARALGIQLREGTITLDAFHLRMREMVKDAQLYSAALAKGGWGQMTRADFGRVGQRVRVQYAYLARLAGELDAGLPMDGTFLARVASYARSGKPTYQVTRREDLADAGFDQERSITHPAEHCEQCLEQEALGFQPIGQMVPIGERQCLSNDKCTAEFRNSLTGVVVAA